MRSSGIYCTLALVILVLTTGCTKTVYVQPQPSPDPPEASSQQRVPPEPQQYYTSTTRDPGMTIQTKHFTIYVNGTEFEKRDVISYLEKQSMLNKASGATVDFAKKSRYDQIRMLVNDHNIEQVLIPKKDAYIKIQQLSAESELASSPYNIHNGDILRALQADNGWVFGAKGNNRLIYLFICRDAKGNNYGLICDVFDSGNMKVRVLHSATES